MIAAGLTILLGGVLTGRRIVTGSDLPLYYYPVKQAIRSLYRRTGNLLWNPYIAEGQPLAANPEHEIFYPFTALLFVLPVAAAVTAALIAHFAIAVAGTIRLVRRLGGSRLAASIAAIAWGFGGVFVSSIVYLPIFFAAAWIPLFASTAAGRGSDRREAAAGGLFGGMILLVGEPVTAAIAILVYAGVFFASPGFRQRLVRVGATILLSAAIGAASVIPGARLASTTVRAHGIDRDIAEIGSFPPARAIEILAARSTGDISRRNVREYFGWRLYREGAWPFFSGLYAGAALLPFAIAGVASEKRRLVSIVCAACAAALLAAGSHGYLWDALRSVSRMWRGIRYPEKFLVGVSLCLVVLAAAGVDAARRSRRALIFISGMLLAIGLTATIAAAFPGLWRDLLARHPGIWRTAGYSTTASPVRRALTRAAAAHVLEAVLVFAAVAVPRRRRMPMALLVLAFGADVLESSRDFVSTEPTSVARIEPPVVRRILAVRPDDPPRVVDLLPEESREVERAGPGPLGPVWARNRVLGEQLIGWGIPLALNDDYDLTNHISSVRATRLVAAVAGIDREKFGALLAQRGACALLIWKTPPRIDDPVAIAGVRGCRPEIDSPSSIVRYRGDSDFLDAVRTAPVPLGTAAMIEEDGPRIEAIDAAAVSTISATPTRIAADVACPSRCLVRVARTNDGHWRATLDGRTAPVWTVDVSMIGVALPPGRRRLVVEYRDPLVPAAAIVSILGISLAAVLAASGRRRLR